MPKILHIFDVSPFIHAGHINKYSKLEQLVDMGTTWKTQVTPTGGTSFLFNTLYDVVGRGDCVFCCDRNPTIKKDMLPSYKSNRVHDRSKSVDKGAAEYILEKCGCTVLARAGYEADDIIYSLVKKFKSSYDHIYVYTGDSDLYFLVSDNVSIRPSSSVAKSVDMSNYERVASKNGIKYNCLTVYKILCGDNSDCIPALPKADQQLLMNLLYQDSLYAKLGDKDTVRNLVSYVYPNLLYQVDLVFPLDVDDLPDEFSTPDKKMIVNFGDAMNNKLFRGLAEINFDVRPYVAEMQARGLYIDKEV